MDHELPAHAEALQVEASRCDPHGPTDHHQEEDAIHADGHGGEDHHTWTTAERSTELFKEIKKMKNIKKGNMNKQEATRNKCIASSNKCLTSSNKKLLI